MCISIYRSQYGAAYVHDICCGKGPCAIGTFICIPRHDGVLRSWFVVIELQLQLSRSRYGCFLFLFISQRKYILYHLPGFTIGHLGMRTHHVLCSPASSPAANDLRRELADGAGLFFVAVGDGDVAWANSLFVFEVTAAAIAARDQLFTGIFY